MSNDSSASEDTSLATRSADATILGYFYQFDHSILQVLSLTSSSSKMVVEGVEDVDLTEKDKSLFIQCKYYRGSTYNHSIIKDAVIAMLRHFAGKGCPSDGSLKYRLYGHYKDGQEKLPTSFGLEFLKKNFLTFKKTDKDDVTTVTEVFTDLGLSDHQLATFQSNLEIDLNAKSYEDQQEEVCKLIRAAIVGASSEDTDAFYYPNAINVIQQLAVNPLVVKRTIAKSEFIARMDRKKAVFSLWLKEKFGDEHYAKSLRKEHFTFGLKVPLAWRIIILEFGSSFDLKSTTSMLESIGTKLSHKEHNSTKQADRFCPYVLLRNVSAADLAALKNALWNPLPEIRGDLPQGMQLRDVDALSRTLAEARNRRKVGTEKRGPSLLEWISDYGGINDVGGELKNLNAETVSRGKGKKTLRLARSLAHRHDQPS